MKHDFFISSFRATGALDGAVVFTNLASDPVLKGSQPRIWRLQWLSTC